MVDRRCARRCIERSLFDLAVEELAAELRIVLRFNHLVELFNGSLQIFRRHAKLLGQTFQRVVLVDATELNKRFDVFCKRVVFLDNARVIDVVAHGSGLFLNGSNKLVTASVFLHEAQAVLIHVNHVVKTGHLAGTSLQGTGTRRC